MFSPVSFWAPPLAVTPKHRSGGSEQTRLNKEKGAAFARPLASRAATWVIGRGVTLERSSVP
jgi:hypothetical protein